MQTDKGERCVEGTVFEPNNLRLVSARDVNVEAPLGGTMLIIANDDQPGVIGEVGTILGRHKVNIANFALGRNEHGAIGVVNVDEEADAPSVLDDAVAELRKVPAIREAWVVRLPDLERWPKTGQRLWLQGGSPSRRSFDGDAQARRGERAPAPAVPPWTGSPST